jgi:hypothetical protein
MSGGYPAIRDEINHAGATGPPPGEEPDIPNEILAAHSLPAGRSAEPAGNEYGLPDPRSSVVDRRRKNDSNHDAKSVRPENRGSRSHEEELSGINPAGFR